MDAARSKTLDNHSHVVRPAEMEWKKTRFPGCEVKGLLLDKRERNPLVHFGFLSATTQQAMTRNESTGFSESLGAVVKRRREFRPRDGSTHPRSV